MKNYSKAIGFIIALAASSAQAVPTLFFNGTIGFDSYTQQLSVTSDLIGTQDIAPAPLLNGSLDFDAQLLSTFFGFGINVGNFGTIAGQDDITVLDAASNTLLTGNFNFLTMSGDDGAIEGTITGELISTGGSLAAQFGVGNLLALQFNLNPTFEFNSTMFDNDFSGQINGDIRGHSVAEPSQLALLSIGILFVGFANKRSRTTL